MKDETLLKVVKLCENCTDDEYQIIVNALLRGARIRKATKTAEAMVTIKTGDVIRLKNIKPKYFNGTKGIVLSKDTNAGKFKVELINPDPRGTRRFGRTPTVDASCVYKREEDN